MAKLNSTVTENEELSAISDDASLFSSLFGSLEELRSRMKSLQTELKKKDDEVRRATDENLALTSRLFAAEQKSSAFNRHVKELRSHVDDLKKENASLREQLGQAVTMGFVKEAKTTEMDNTSPTIVTQEVLEKEIGEIVKEQKFITAENLVLSLKPLILRTSDAKVTFQRALKKVCSVYKFDGQAYLTLRTECVPDTTDTDGIKVPFDEEHVTSITEIMCSSALPTEIVLAVFNNIKFICTNRSPPEIKTGLMQVTLALGVETTEFYLKCPFGDFPLMDDSLVQMHYARVTQWEFRCNAIVLTICRPRDEDSFDQALHDVLNWQASAPLLVMSYSPQKNSTKSRSPKSSMGEKHPVNETQRIPRAPPVSPTIQSIRGESNGKRRSNTSFPVHSVKLGQTPSSVPYSVSLSAPTMPGFPRKTSAPPTIQKRAND